MSRMFPARRRVSFLQLFVVTAVAIGIGDLRDAHAQHAAIDSFGYLAGGTWSGEGTWPDGSPLRVEQRYFWGPTEQILHFQTWDVADGTRQLLYEGVLYVDPVIDGVVQINVRSDGQVTRQEVTRWDMTGYEISGPDTRSTVRYDGGDLFTWELRVMQEGKWEPILKAEYRRHPRDRQP